MAAAAPWPRSGGSRRAPQRRLGPGLGPGRAPLRRGLGLRLRGLRGLRLSSSGSRGGHSLWARPPQPSAERAQAAPPPQPGQGGAAPAPPAHRPRAPPSRRGQQSSERAPSNRLSFLSMPLGGSSPVRRLSSMVRIPTPPPSSPATLGKSLYLSEL
ncbi:uncharacterized protein [Gorilla gorilla gorilla]|uniref:uncharacterized protein n=1 Tax=Gorilla gorilla gorilla TaxID=9595 RepID=UPI003009A51F